MQNERNKILEKHRERLKGAIHAIFDPMKEQDIGINKEDLFDIVDDSVDQSIGDNGERIPEYYSIYHDFTVVLALRLDRLLDEGMPDPIAQRVMELVNSHRNEAIQEKGLEGRVEAKKTAMPAFDISELKTPEGFRKK